MNDNNLGSRWILKNLKIDPGLCLHHHRYTLTGHDKKYDKNKIIIAYHKNKIILAYNANM